MYGLEMNYASAAVDTDFEVLVRTSKEKTFTFMHRWNIGSLGMAETTKMNWKDTAIGTRSTTEDRRDVWLPYLDIPQSGSLQFVKAASAIVGTMSGVVIGHPLTKNVVARLLLGSAPETISWTSDGTISLDNLKPNFPLQGGE